MGDLSGNIIFLKFTVEQWTVLRILFCFLNKLLTCLIINSCYSIIEWRSYFICNICVDFIQGACTRSLDSQVQGASTSPSPPMTLTTSQSLPPQALLVVLSLWGHSIDLAGLAHRKNSLTLHCFLSWNSNQSDKISPPYPLVLTQSKSATHPQSGLGLGSLLTPNKTVSPLVFFRLHWLERCPCSSENLAGTF